MVIDFCKDLGVQIKFMCIVHSQAVGQAEYMNKVIIKGLKKKLDDAKGLWAKLLRKKPWSYHTKPRSTTKEIPFFMVCGAYAMLLVEIKTLL